MSLPTTGVLFSGSQPAAAPGNQLCEPQTDGGTPAQIVSFAPRLATADKAGVVRPDGTTLAVDVNGVMSAIATGTGPGGGGTSASGGLYVCVSPTQDPADGTGTQWILPAPQLAGTIGWLNRNDAMQRQLGTKAQFSVQGTQLTLKYPLEADPDSYLEYYYIQGTPNSQSGGGGSVTPTGIRGTSSVSVTASATLVIPLPAGAQAGDMAVLFTSHAYNTGVPTGWTGLHNYVGFNWNGFSAWELLTSADIAAGHISVSAASAEHGMAALFVFAGSTSGIREHEFSNGHVSGAGSDVLSTSSAVLNTDTGIYFGSAANGANPIVSLSPGATLESPSNVYGAALMSAQAMPGGVTAQTLNYSDANVGFLHFVVIVKG